MGTQNQKESSSSTVNRKNRHITQNPYTGEAIGSYDFMTENEAMVALEDCHTAFLTWSQSPLESRQEIIKEMANLLRDNKEELAELMTSEMGKRYSEGLDEVDLCAAICDYCAKSAPEHLADEHKEFDGGRALISYRPQGVILSVQPWNFPLYQVIRYSVPNLLAGNTTLLKHARNVWGMGQRIESLFAEAGLPKDVFKHLTIDSDLIPKLIEQPMVRGVTLTGSEKAGRSVAEHAGKNLKKCVLELGGSDAYIVLEDADLEKAAKVCAQGRVGNNGQICTAAKRIIVVEEVFDRFKDLFVDEMKDLQMGDPMDSETRLGPLAREDLVEKLEEQVLDSLDQGATCLTGGHRPHRKGYFFESTVLTDLEPGMPAYDEELFGPVASLIRASDEHDAIRIANDTRFGLGGGVFSGDQDRAIRIAREELDTGMCNVNGFNLAIPNLPFGGVKNSGFGREHARFGFHEFVNIKSVIIDGQEES